MSAAIGALIRLNNLFQLNADSKQVIDQLLINVRRNMYMYLYMHRFSRLTHAMKQNIQDKVHLS